MISPEIWESSSFSKLSDFAKLVFIGLFSNADDSGKGSADAGLLKSKLFPRDEKKRVTDITNALSEIARNMSINFYEVEGNNYYILTAWRKWQKIDRPTPSKLPNPPETMGERGRTTQNSSFDEGSTSNQRGLDEGSSLNEIERNEIESKYVSKKDIEINNDNGDIARTYARASYKELMDAHEIPERVQLELWRFIQHCHANGQVITNDRLQSLWFKLKKLYRLSDVSGMVQALRTAIDKGYYDIKDGKGWIAESLDAMRAAGINPPGDIDEDEEDSE